MSVKNRKKVTSIFSDTKKQEGAGIAAFRGVIKIHHRISQREVSDFQIFNCELTVAHLRSHTGGLFTFCSKCGQEQVSESVRFCSRCGFELNITEEPTVKLLIKMILFLVLAVCAVMGWGSITAGPNYLQLRIIITLISFVTFYLLFSRDLKHIFNKLFSQDIELSKQITTAKKKPGLPSPQSIPVSDFEIRREKTAELAQPPSVTEQTTTLLDKKS